MTILLSATLTNAKWGMGVQMKEWGKKFHSCEITNFFVYTQLGIFMGTAKVASFVGIISIQVA